MRVRVPLLVVSVVSAFSPPPDSSAVVAKIQIEGNRITKDYVIRREIQHPVGAPFDSTIAAEDRNRIDNLEIFSQVSFSKVPNDDRSEMIIYHVEEAWRVFPAPVIIFQEEKGWSFGGAVMIKNFRGRNEVLQAAAATGGEAFGTIQFQNPWITGDHVSLQAHAYFTSYEHPFLGFTYRERDGEVTFGRYFGYDWKLWITGSVEQRLADYSDRGTEDLKHQYFQTKIKVIYDTRDLYIDPSRGMVIYNEWRPEIGLNRTSPHNAYWDSRVSLYRTVVKGRRKWVAGGSLFFHKYFGVSIPYKIMMAGGSKSIRGWALLDSAMYERDPDRAGLNEYFASFELRQTLIPKHLIGPRMEFGLILVEFVDMGAADDMFSRMLNKSPLAGVGIGMRMFVPGAFLLRVDFGLGFHNGKWQSGQWHVDMGHKF
ncbi:MAG: BamA/TamA family outer membrane protein [Candidatus Neomarinimicrobiota bacterium]